MRLEVSSPNSQTLAHALTLGDMLALSECCVFEFLRSSEHFRHEWRVYLLQSRLGESLRDIGP